ncbi:MAG: amino acid/amide transporter substrate-binding protein family, partial [Frankiales bacterium]|nr:amino acid/amide transporter substrate-binding protein family [Frankiales bacterium]
MPRRHHALAALLVGAVLAACSSAPAPQSLTGPDAASTGSADPTTGDGGTTKGNAPATTSTTGQVPGSTTSSSGGTAGFTSGATGSSGTTSGTATSGTAGTGTTGGDPVDTSSVHLFTAKEDRIGISKGAITLCAHAALTYAPAFHTEPSDLNVFWTAINAEKGGVLGRKVTESYEDDGYDPQKAVTAAKACVAKKPFLMLGGIGFDQIPTVRNYAESVHQLYVYHTATVKGSAGNRYSFTPLPTVEQMGEGFAKLAAQKYKGKKIGILERDSANWAPGVDAFKKLAKSYGLNIVDEEKAAASAGNYTS